VEELSQRYLCGLCFGLIVVEGGFLSQLHQKLCHRSFVVDIHVVHLNNDFIDWKSQIVQKFCCHCCLELVLESWVKKLIHLKCQDLSLTNHLHPLQKQV